MTDRYGGRYPPRARSPPLFNPARTSLPINISGYVPPYEGHLHVVPASRHEVITGPRSSASSVNNGGTITTTYKIKPDVPTRGSSVREGSRTRRSSTIDTNNRPPATAVVTTAAPRHRPVVHSSGGPRPASPIKNTYRSSEEEYVTIPATSRHGHHHHHKHHSSHPEGSDPNRISNERDGGRLRIAPVREHAYTARARQAYAGALVRHSDPVADDYGDNGYLYTKPGDLAQYDLEHNEPAPPRRPRRDSFDGGRQGRPNSISGYGDLVPRTYETRERGPPPSTRGFDKIRAPTWDHPARMPVPPSPIDPAHRPFDPIEPPRRSNSRARASTYHDRDPRRGPREEIYEVKEDHRRPHRHERYDDSVEQRGFGIRTDRPERVERNERSEWAESTHRPERIDRPERSERIERGETDRPREKEHKSRDVLATGLSIASAALGLNAVKNATRDDREDREDREERRRRDDKEEFRRDRDDRDRDVLDSNGRDTKERRSRDDDVSARRVIPPRDTPSPREKARDDRSPVKTDPVEANSRDLKERRTSRDERNANTERREHRRSHQSDSDTPSEDTSSSDDNTPHPRRERQVRDPAAQPAFNPKDTTDLKALKEALNAKDATPKANNEESRTPRESSTKDAAEVAEIRKDLKEERQGREPLASTENKQLRVVSPPREKPEEKPVKGILRQPRDKFPEDPAPVREGVAPLKDAKKDGIPPDARWTKISRRLVNPEALEAGKERFEAREDFVIVLRVLSKEEVQGYAEVTERIRAAREELDEIEAKERRAARRARHERHKRERNGEVPRSERSERRQHRRLGRDRDSGSHSESDTSDTDYHDDRVSDKPKMLEAPRKKATFDEALMSGGLGDAHSVSTGALNMGNLKETAPGQYSGYVRNPPPPMSLAATAGGGRR